MITFRDLSIRNLKNLEMGLLKTTGAWKAFGGLFVGDEEGGREVERREEDAVVSLVVSKRQRGRGRGQSPRNTHSSLNASPSPLSTSLFTANGKLGWMSEEICWDPGSQRRWGALQ